MKKICEVCGKEFEPNVYNQKYCSKKCYKFISNQKDRVKYHATKTLKPKRSPKKRICEICGIEFETQSQWRKTCSDECSSKLRRKKANRLTEELGADKKFVVPEEKFYLRIKTAEEEHSFRTLKSAVNYLSAYSKYDAATVLKAILEHKNKIDYWYVFYD